MISVIVPVYNVERYLRKCVRSILAQDCRYMEVILVNDASTDSSPAICRDLESGDSRIKVVDKPVNEGLDMARFTGLANMSPEADYVTFVDSDDWLSSGILSRCMAVAEESDADFVQMNLRRCYDRLGIVGTTMNRLTGHEPYELTEMTSDVFAEKYISFFGWNILSVNVCGKVYRTEFLRRSGIGPSRVRWGEDLIMNMRLFPHVRRFATVDRVGYNYRVGGMTSRYLPNLLKCAMEMFLLKEQAIHEYSYDRGTLWARVEMKNILKTSVEQRIAYRIENGREEIAALLADPMWDRIAEIVTDTRFASDPFVKAMAARDVDALFSHCATYTRPNGIRHWMRQALMRLIC